MPPAARAPLWLESDGSEESQGVSPHVVSHRPAYKPDCLIKNCGRFLALSHPAARILPVCLTAAVPADVTFPLLAFVALRRTVTSFSSVLLCGCSFPPLLSTRSTMSR